MKVFKNTTVKGYDGKAIQLPMLDGNVTVIKDGLLVNILYAVLNNAQIQPQNDSIQMVRLIIALDKARDKGGDIELEDGVHDWLKIKAEGATPPIFRQNGNEVYKHICEGFEKPKQPDRKEHKHE